MEKEAWRFLITTFMLLAIAITSFVATLESIPLEIRTIAIGITAVLIVVAFIAHYALKKRG